MELSRNRVTPCKLLNYGNFIHCFEFFKYSNKGVDF